ncbi:MAG: L,D-transpeptidase [Gammaproteobacteria bacterium]|nr:L,D-transpeptidase [Gammaproteobacteria bacterium]
MLALAFCLAWQALHAAQPSWILIDTAQQTLSVMQGDAPAMRLFDIAIGRYGATAEKRQGDNMTPLGRFRINDIRRSDTFHRFVALDYPGVERAETALQSGLINEATRDRITRAHRSHRAPPQSTELGGHIGIHGLGGADPAVHASMNWTRGCVALTNTQIDALVPWLRVGMTVEIR